MKVQRKINIAVKNESIQKVPTELNNDYLKFKEMVMLIDDIEILKAITPDLTSIFSDTSNGDIKIKFQYLEMLKSLIAEAYDLEQTRTILLKIYQKAIECRLHKQELNEYDHTAKNIYLLVYNQIPDQVTRLVSSQLSEVEHVQKFFQIIIRDNNLQLLHDVLADPSSSLAKEHLIVIEFDQLEIVKGVFRLNVLASPSHYTQLPIVSEISLVDESGTVLPPRFDVWKKILILAGVPTKALGKFIMLSHTSQADILSYESFALRSDFDAFLEYQVQRLTPEEKFALMVTMARTNQYDGLDYCLQNDWHIQEFCSSANSFKGSFFSKRSVAAIMFLTLIVPSSANLKTLVMICQTMETIDLWDSKGRRVLHKIINRPNQNESLILIKWLVARRKLTSLFSSRDRPSIIEWAVKCQKHDIVDYLEDMEEKQLDEDKVTTLFVKSVTKDVSNYGSYFPDVTIINQIYGTHFKPGEIIGLSTINSPGAPDLNLLAFTQVLLDKKIGYISDIQENNIIYINKVSFLAYERRQAIAQQLRNEENKMRKKEKRRQENMFKPPPELASVNILAVGGNVHGKDRKEKVKVAVMDKPETKFTQIARDKIYLKYHQNKCNSLYSIYSGIRVYHNVDAVRGRLTLNEFKYRALDILGQSYHEDLICLVFAQEYYDPKLASAFEKSKCSAYYSNFKNRQVEEVHAVAAVSFSQDRKDEDLVEVVNPFKILKASKTVLSKKTERLVSVNLEAAKHEFLFLKGLFCWKQELDKPLPIHNDIFEDCLRLGAVRFYNAILLYSREVKSGGLGEFVSFISYDDSQASQIRNVLAHNFLPIEIIRADVESLLFRLGERVVDICSGLKISPAVISLATSALFKIEIKVFDRAVDGTFCRLAIKDKLVTMQSYVLLIQSKQTLDKNSELLKVLNADWENLSTELKIWIHHARAIESCILQIGELSRASNKFLSPNIQKYLLLCREVRHIGYHVNVCNEGNRPDEWNFDPIVPDFLADLIEGIRQLPL